MKDRGLTVYAACLNKSSKDLFNFLRTTFVL